MTSRSDEFAENGYSVAVGISVNLYRASLFISIVSRYFVYVCYFVPSVACELAVLEQLQQQQRRHHQYQQQK